MEQVLHWSQLSFTVLELLKIGGPEFSTEGKGT